MTSAPAPNHEALALLDRVALISDLDADERSQLASLLRPFVRAAGELLFRQGAAPNGLYLLAEGWVVVSVRMFGSDELTLTELGPGATVGELSLIDRQPRSATARARTYVRGFVLDTRSFDGLRAYLQLSALKLTHRLARVVCQQLRRLHAQLAGDSGACGPEAAVLTHRPLDATDLPWLRILPSLAAFTDEELADLAELLVGVDAPRGTVMYRAGDPADCLYLLVRGAVELRAGVCDRGARLAVHGPGQWFGQVPLLDGGTRSATCTIREDARLVALSAAALAGLWATPSTLAFKVADALIEATSHNIRAASRRIAQHTTARAHASSS